MLAANPQRTSWVPEEVRGELNVEWYHPIEPYIHYKIQPIAANGKLYVSTARGLYTFSAASGELLWVYPTEQPLGHSPTIATINGKSIAFVGGYDRKIHALDANSGEEINGYTPFEATAGFETNPLVVNNTIYAGNRDGYFYALDARKYYQDLKEAQPEMFDAFMGLHKGVFEKESALSQKIKELIAVAVAHTTQCPYCIESHVKAAQKAGASKAEIAEAISIAVALRAGGAFAHSTVAMSSLER